jgi:hypothetical protein
MAEPSKALLAVPSPAEVDKIAILYAAGKEKVLQATLAQRAAADELELVQKSRRIDHPQFKPGRNRPPECAGAYRQ